MEEGKLRLNEIENTQITRLEFYTYKRNYSLINFIQSNFKS